MKNSGFFISVLDVFDKASNINQLIKLELRRICSADTQTDVPCDENVLNLISLC